MIKAKKIFYFIFLKNKLNEIEGDNFPLIPKYPIIE